MKHHNYHRSRCAVVGASSRASWLHFLLLPVMACSSNATGDSVVPPPPVADAGFGESDASDEETLRPPLDGATPEGAVTPDEADAAVACVEGGACTTNLGAPCLEGWVKCAGGKPQCIDGPPVRDGTTCSFGLCSLGSCIPPHTISESVDLSLTPVTAWRTCAEASAFSVASLEAEQATLSAVPQSDCLAVGDEVMLVNLQGSAGATVNVGNWELLQVKSVISLVVEFTTPKARSYGSSAGSDANVGTGPSDQKVALFRVPRFGDLTIAAGVGVGSAAWSGSIGGVFVVRAARLTLEGTISMVAAGYRSGRWSLDDSDCLDNVATESGESISGPAVVSTGNNEGGPGGISAVSGVCFNGDTPLLGGAGHAVAGQAGIAGPGRAPGAPGVAYGVADGTRVTMGSGAGGGLTCDPSSSGPVLISGGTSAGGIVVLLTDQLKIGASGAISASAGHAGRDVSASGGYIFVRGCGLDMGTNRVSAVGGIGTLEDGPSAGQSAKSSDGYIVLSGSEIGGTTIPAAIQLANECPR